MSIAARIENLQKRLGGFRIQTQFEYTFGATVLEQNNITAAPEHQIRIISELVFLHKLSEINSGKYDGLISDSVSLLEAALSSKGTITAEDSQNAEELLMPASCDAKEYRVILAAHAHIDMNWLWTWHETVAATLDTFRTMLKLMEDYPTFCFSQSQAAVYKIVEDYDPEMMEQIKDRIAEGRWESTASSWVENDHNMVSASSCISHHYYTKKYMTKAYGVRPESMKIEFCPDTFGHNANLPELMKMGEVKYMYHCRGGDFDHILYRYRAPSGAESLNYREPFWYNSGITPHIGISLPEISQRNAGLKTGLIVYGVGNHGGGPTRRDIELAIRMNEWRIFPKITFGTLHEYFEIAETVYDKLPVVDKELNHIFTGCYTSQSRLKQANRLSEAAMENAQMLNSFASLKADAPYYHNRFEKAWQNIMFGHFHDILTGSCIAESREYGLGIYDEAIAIANVAAGNSMRAIAAQVDTSDYAQIVKGAQMSQAQGAGVGYSDNANFASGHFLGAPFGISTPESMGGDTRIFNVFNPSAHERREMVELTVWDWCNDLSAVCFKNAKGEIIDHQLIDEQMQKYWDHRYFRVLADVTIPACGYTTVVLTRKERQNIDVFHYSGDNVQKPIENSVLENEYIRAVFSYESAALISLTDKKTGKEMLSGSGQLCLVETEAGTSSAWTIGRYIKKLPLEDCREITFTKGDLRSTLFAVYNFGNSEVRLSFSLDKGSKKLGVKLELDCCEFSKPGEKVPVLIYDLPTKGDYFLHDIPMGVLKTEAKNQDVPCLSFTAAVHGKRAVALSCDSRYGYRNAKEGISLTLLNIQNRPDKYPEIGVQSLAFAIMIEDADNKSLSDAAYDFCRKPVYVTNTVHKGTLDKDCSFMSICGNAVVSEVKKSEKTDGIVVYVTNLENTAQQITLTLCSEIKSAHAVNSLENAVEGVVEILNNTIKAEIGANKMMGILFETE